MEDPHKPVLADIDSLPIREIDDADRTTIDKGASQDQYGYRPSEVSIVLAPRPFAYREPIGASADDGTAHPKRRSSDR